MPGEVEDRESTCRKRSSLGMGDPISCVHSQLPLAVTVACMVVSFKLGEKGERVPWKYIGGAGGQERLWNYNSSCPQHTLCQMWGGHLASP